MMWSGSSLDSDCVLTNHRHCAVNKSVSRAGMIHAKGDRAASGRTLELSTLEARFEEWASIFVSGTKTLEGASGMVVGRLPFLVRYTL
jgi:hypothetical protein